MENNAPSLGDQIARLHGTVQAQEKCAWIPAAIHTLIMAALARIFGRLEALLRLWQAGTLPAPQPRTPSSRDSTKIAPPRPATPARNRHRAAKLTAASPEPNVIQSEAKDPGLQPPGQTFEPIPHGSIEAGAGLR